MAVAFGKQVIDTSPCVDPTNNFQELANVLEALGNPYPPGPDDVVVENPWGGANFTEGCGIEITATPGEYNIATKRKPSELLEEGQTLIGCDADGLYGTGGGGGGGETYTAGFGIDISADNVISWTGSAGGTYTDGDYIDGSLLAAGIIQVLAEHIGISVELIT